MRKKVQKFKRTLSIKISKYPNIHKILGYCNLVVFHLKEHKRITHPGKEDEDKIYYVIYPRSNTEGLLATYYYVLKNVKWSIKKGYIPYVDFGDERCQYFEKRLINNTNNAWEYYFTQPVGGLSSEILKSKKNVIKSGWCFWDKMPPLKLSLKTVKEKDNIYIVNSLLKIQPYILQYVEEFVSKEFKNKKILGVFIRGTDYVSLKPSGHYVQPNINQVIEKVKEYILLYNPEKIFLVTEDLSYYKIMQESFGGLVFSSDNTFADKYSPGNFISESLETSPYERGLKYLVRLIILSRCNYLVSSLTNGSIFAYGIKKESFEDSYWFDLGVYE